jgi:hypothetical protein
MKNLSQESLCSDRGLSGEPTEFKAEEILSKPTCFVRVILKWILKKLDLRM